MTTNNLPTDFTELISWQKARILVLDIYKLTDSWRDFGLKDQLRRAVVSIMNNIAEGYSRRTAKETLRYFDIAIGSCVEVKSMTYLLEDLELQDPEQIIALRNKVMEVHKIAFGYVKYLKHKISDS
jgi:four helix bundle protein